MSKNKKVFCTIEEQIEILKGRNLIILDEERTYQLLLRYGYYEIINGYKDFLINGESKNKEKFIDGATFEHIFALYELDKKLRNAILEATLEIESSLRTAVAHTISELYGDEEKLYLNRIHYKPGKPNFENGIQKGYKIDQLINKFKKINNDDIQPMKHYRQSHGNIPPWIMIKGTSFGNVINFTKLQKPVAKKKIFSILSNLPEEIFDIIPEYKDFFIDSLFLCHAFRNRAAHSGRIYNYRATNAEIRYNIVFHHKYGITEADYRHNKGRNDLATLFNVLDMFDNKMAKLSLEFALNYHLDQHIKKYPNDKKSLLIEMGLPLDYKIEIYK